MTGKRGPVTGALYGQKSGPQADPDRQKRMGRPGSKAKVPAKRARTTTEIFQAINTDPPPVPDGLGPVGAAVWTDVWEALPILSPKLDHSAVLSFCLVSEDAVRARAAIDEHGLLISEDGDARGGTCGHKVGHATARERPEMVSSIRGLSRPRVEPGESAPARHGEKSGGLGQVLAERWPLECSRLTFDIETKRP